MFELNEETILMFIIASPPVLLLLFAAIRHFSEIYRLKRFEPVQVKILSKRLGGGYSKGHWNNAQSLFFPVIEYQYQVGDKTYQSFQVTPTPQMPIFAKKGLFLHSDDYSGAQQVLNRFTEGEQYEGFYNPKSPNQSYLIKESDVTISELVTFSIVYLFTILIVKLGWPE